MHASAGDALEGLIVSSSSVTSSTGTKIFVSLPIKSLDALSPQKQLGAIGKNKDSGLAHISDRLSAA
jgi:hypothetical protein